jgi:hypothetical protein
MPAGIVYRRRQTLSRFARQPEGKKFTPESLATYKSRFTRAVATFLEYSKNPAAWKPKIQSAPRREKAAATNGNQAGSSQVTTPLPVADAPTPQPPTSRAGLVEYPFPLREGRFAYLRLPADLTAADVKRLTAHLNPLALEDVA